MLGLLSMMMPTTAGSPVDITPEPEGKNGWASANARAATASIRTAIKSHRLILIFLSDVLFRDSKKASVENRIRFGLRRFSMYISRGIPTDTSAIKNRGFRKLINRKVFYLVA